MSEDMSPSLYKKIIEDLTVNKAPAPSEWDFIEAPIDRMVADFYLLEAITAIAPNSENLSNSDRHELMSLESSDIDTDMSKFNLDPALIKKLNHVKMELAKENPKLALKDVLSEAQEVFTEYVDTYCDDLVLPYTQMIIGGELRYWWNIVEDNAVSYDDAPSTDDVFNYGSFMWPLDQAGRKGAWARWKHIVDKYEADAFAAASNLFTHTIKLDDVGGDNWAAIASTVCKAMRGELGSTDFYNKKVFLDRIFNLEHNNGSVFTKWNWPSSKCAYTHWSELESTVLLEFVLDAHGNSDWVRLKAFASHPVSVLFDRYWIAINNVTGDKAPIPNVSKWMDEEGYSCLVRLAEDKGYM